MGTCGRLRAAVRVGLAAGLALALTACTGRGGGYLPPGPGAGAVAFTGPANLGFSFSCEDKGGLNPQPGRLRLELQYSDRGTSPQATAPFSIHGTADSIDPVLESQICSGQAPPVVANELIFLGRFRTTSAPPPGWPAVCSTRTTTAPSCRFEVIARDNDRDLAPSPGDSFAIKLSSASAVPSQLAPGPVFYARAGVLARGSLTVH